MKNISFGKLLDKLLYLSNQKKSRLAKELGYDISYISKWINGKNLPTQKSINTICKTTSEFIVSSLTGKSKDEFKHYFEIDIQIDDDTFLTQYIERSLKDAYMHEAQRTSSIIYKGTQSEDNYNSIMHINPRLRKQYLSKDMGLHVSNSKEIDIILSANLYRLNNVDKMSISTMKNELEELKGNHNIKVRFLMGIKEEHKDFKLNTLLILTMISQYPDMDFKIYNCDVDSNAILTVIKDRIFHSAIFSSDGRCLFTNMTKEKNILEEIYYSLKEMLKSQAKPLVENTSVENIICSKTYIQYMMSQGLKWIIGSMNELFMPPDLFMEIAQKVFNGKDEILSELKQINAFLQNATYQTDIDTLIYENALREYISTGKLYFFNHEVNLDLDQRQRHIKYISENIINRNNISIKLVEDDFIEEFKSTINPTIYLSRNIRFLKTHPNADINDYCLIKDNEFKSICDTLFVEIWEDKNSISDKEYIVERITQSLLYTKIINGIID